MSSKEPCSEEQVEDAVWPLAKHVLAVKYEHIPQADIDAAKLSILDTLGVALAGSSADGCSVVADFAKEQEGKEESTIWIYGNRVPAVNAVLANCTMARARDLGNVHPKAQVHLSESTVPVAFAMAERQGAVSGRDLIAAVVVGNDLIARLTLACNQNLIMVNGVDPAWAHGVFGAVAVAGKLLELDEEAMVNALGFSVGQAMFTLQGQNEGSKWWPMCHGLTAHAGVLSALMAKKGIAGSKQVFEGQFGYYNSFVQGNYSRSELVKDLGKRFEGSYASFKPYPCCAHTHAAIAAALTLVQKHNIKPEEVKGIVVQGNDVMAINMSIPRETKCNPPNPVVAMFSLPWTVATAIVKRSVGLDDFTQDAVEDKRVIELANRVFVQEDPALSAGARVSPAVVEITTKDGKIYRERVEHCKGHPADPFSADEMADRFRGLARYAARPLPSEKVESIITMIRNLENLDDAAKVVSLIS